MCRHWGQASQREGKALAKTDPRVWGINGKKGEDGEGQRRGDHEGFRGFGE